MIKRLLNKLKCAWGGHRMGDYRTVSEQSIKFKCLRCQRDLVYNKYTEAMIPWDEKIAAFYEDFAKLQKEMSKDLESTEIPQPKERV